MTGLAFRNCPLAALALSLAATTAIARGQGTASQDIPPALHGDSLGDGGPALQARLVTPVGLARDAQGNLYISERGAHRIRRVDAATGVITTFAGTGQAGFAGDGGPAVRARLTQPDEIIVDSAGNLIFGDVFNHRVRKVDVRTGIITTIAGTGEPGYSGDGGAATSARLNGPFGVALDSRGNLFITDTENQRIRRIDARTGIITTVAGNGVWDYAGDNGPAMEASFARPHRVLVQGDTALLIGDSFNFRIRRIDLRTGIIRLVAGSGERGSGGDGGPAIEAPFTYHGSLAFAPDGDLIVPSLAAARIKRIDRETGVITTIAGNGLRGLSGDGGPAVEATLHLPLSVVLDPDGNILFTDMWNGRVRHIDRRTGVITTVVGSARSPETPAVRWDFYYNRDSLEALLDEPVRYTMPSTAAARVVRNVAHGTGRGRYARFDAYLPPALPRDARRPAVVLVPGRNDNEVRFKDTGGFESWARLVAASGLVAVVLDHSLGTRGRSLEPAGADLASAIEHVRRNAAELQVDPDRICVFGFSSGAALLAPILAEQASWLRCAAAYYPHVDPRRDDPFFWTLETPDVRRRFALATVLSTVPLPLFVVRAGRDQAAVNTPLDELRPSLAASDNVVLLEHPAGATGFERTLDDETTRTIVRRTLCFLQRTLAVRETQCEPAEAVPNGGRVAMTTDSIGDGGPAAAALLDRPVSVALDRRGNLYVTEQRGHRVRRVDAQSGVITTVAGTGVSGSAGDGGPAPKAQVSYPKVALDQAGNVYVGEVDGYRIRRIEAATGIITTIAGTGVMGFSGDGGPATSAQITRPFGIALDSSANLYFTDTEVNRVRRIDAATGVITTVAGDGRYGFDGDGGPATAAALRRPHVITFDPDGNLIIGDSFNQRIRRVDRRTGAITTIAGSGYRGVSGDGGPALDATFVYFGGLAYDTAGNLLVSGVGDHRIRRIDRGTGIITAFAGSGRWESNGDGLPALEASFHPALELAVDSSNNVYAADAYGGRVRRIDGRTGIVTTIAGSAPPAPRPGDFHVHVDSAHLARLYDTPVALSIEGAERARVMQDLDYTGTGDPRRRLDVYLPPAVDLPPPVVMLLHGGDGTDLRRALKDWGAWTSRGKLLAASGFAGVTFTHRLNLEAGLESASADLAAALSYLRANAKSLALDTDRICVVAYGDGVPLLSEIVRQRPRGVRCLVAFSPVLDLGSQPPPFWLEQSSSTRDRFSLAKLIRSGATPPPALLLVGAQDSERIVGGARALAALARERGLSAELLEHPTGGAAFDRGAPGAQTQEMLRAWLEFLRRRLR